MSFSPEPQRRLRTMIEERAWQVVYYLSCLTSVGSGMAGFMPQAWLEEVQETTGHFHGSIGQVIEQFEEWQLPPRAGLFALAALSAFAALYADRQVTQLQDERAQW